jgi:hypothetical protein
MNDECAICRESYEIEDKTRLDCRILECAHYYHTECIDTWLQQDSRCPLCRRVVSNRELTNFVMFHMTDLNGFFDLLDEYAPIANVVDAHGRSLLTYLISMLRYGANNYSLKDKINYLLLARDTHRVEAAEYYNGTSILIYYISCLYGDIDIYHCDNIQLLIDKYGNINYLCDDMTALLMAMNCRAYHVCHLLLISGAQIVDASGYSAISFFGTYLENRDKWLLRLFLEYGADINAIDYNDMTLLMNAARNMNLNTISFLLRYGADVNTQNSQGLVAYNYLWPEYDTIPDYVIENLKRLLQPNIDKLKIRRSPRFLLNKFI